MGFVEVIIETIANYKKMHKYDKNNYSIFDALEITDNEVMMCRFLTDLLNPLGRHNNGNKYLKSFLHDVLHDDFSEEELNSTRVYKEYLIEGNRRIDIVIRNLNHFIPIEVKINAVEQESQCYDYYKFASSLDCNAKIVYLTKTGTQPSEYSTTREIGGMKEKVPDEKIVCISFINDIRLWLEKVVANETGITQQIVKQYISAVNAFTGLPDEELRMEISKEMLSSEINFRTSLQITANMNFAKANLIKLVMEEFEKQMQPLETYGLKKESRCNWLSYDQQATEDFYHKYSTYPGINYVVKNVHLMEGISMWFRIEIEHNLFAGLCLFDYDTGSEKKVNEMDEKLKQQVLQHLKITNIDSESWWILWCYLPTASSNSKLNAGSVPNFKEMNEAAIRLVDQTNRVKFVEQSIIAIENYVLNFLK